MITVFKSMDSHGTPEFYDIQDVLDRIRRGNNRSLIAQIRAETNKPDRDKLKKQLLWILFSGKFQARLNDAMIQHSGFICLDFDGMQPADLRKWRVILTGNPHTYALFTSPSGNGLKIIWKIPACKTNEEHNRRFDAIALEFETCAFFDKNVKGWNRVCFESYDPELYQNKNAKLFTGIIGEPEIKPQPAQSSGQALTDSEEIAARLITWFERTNNLRRGNRDAGAFCFASAISDYIPESEGWQIAYNYIASNVEQSADDPFTENEIKKCISQAYRKNPFPTKKMNISGDDIPNVDDTLVELVESETVEKKTIFWKRTQRGEYAIDYLALKHFLQLNGFFRYDLNNKDFEFIRIQEQTVEPVAVRHIKDFVLAYLERWKEQGVYNMIAGNSKFKKDYLDFLDNKTIVWNKDDKDSSWIYYRNCAVRVTENGAEIKSYLDLSGFIWKSQKKDRDFQIGVSEGDAAKFISNINAGDPNRVRSYMSAMGYLLHNHKSFSRVPAVVLTDEIISNEPNGGSGKGLTLKMIAKIRKTEIIDGKNFNTGKSFVMQRVDLDTKIIQIDDIPRNFDFEKLFSQITEGVTVEKKFQGEIYMNFEDSPKFVINTNTVLKGSSDSHERRKFELELCDHYNARHQPIDDFKREFFRDWDAAEWLRFDNFMVDCLKLYLSEGLIKPVYVNMEIKKLIRETSEEFVNFAREEFRNDRQYHKLKMCELYKAEQGRKGDYPTKSIFTKWMKLWGEHNGWEVKDGGGGRNWIIYGEGLTLVEPETGDAPF